MKIINTFLVLMLASMLALPVAIYAQGAGAQDRLRDQDQIRDPTASGGTAADQDRYRTQDQDRVMLKATTTSETPMLIMEQNQVRTQAQERVLVPGATNTAAELRARIQERQQVMEQERVIATTSQLQDTLREQNRSRVAVRAMLDAGALFGARAEEANRVASEIGASVEQTVAMEAKIQSRGFFRRVFMGGDVDTAKQLEAELLQTQDRLRDMDRLIQDCDCDGPTRDILQEQLRLLDQDRDRLNNLVLEQYDRTGLLGWLFR